MRIEITGKDKGSNWLGMIAFNVIKNGIWKTGIFKNSRFRF